MNTKISYDWFEIRYDYTTKMYQVLAYNEYLSQYGIAADCISVHEWYLMAELSMAKCYVLKLFGGMKVRK